MTTTALPTALDPATIRRTVLPNGLRVLVRRDRSAPVVAIVTYVSAGYFDETDDVVGIAHVLEHMFFKGTPTRGVGEIAQADEGGGRLSERRHDLRSHQLLHGAAVVRLRAGARRAGRRVRQLADRRRRARARARGDHPGGEAQGGQSGRRRDGDAVRAAARPPSHPALAHRPRAGAARARRASDARRLLSQLLSSRATRCSSIVGDVDPDEALRRGAARATARCRRATPARYPGPTEEGAPGFRYRELAGDIGQTQVAFGWRTPGTTHPRHARARPARHRAGQRTRVAALPRGARATARLVGIGVRLHADGARRVRRARRNAAGAARSTRRARSGRSCATLRERRRRASAEVERAKRIYESQWVRRLEDMEGQANYLAEWEALGDWRQRRRVSRARADGDDATS